jgi:hypothetical protein
VAQKFFQTHADIYDQLVLWTDTTLVGENTFAYQALVKNQVRGIGQDVLDLSSNFGSGGRLESVVDMDALSKYPDDPAVKVPRQGENSTLSIMGQEVGHRWLAYLRFRDHKGDSSDALLGRDLAHWSFFFNSDASVMEGNRIQDLGGGSFKTVAAVEKYSSLDQYAMGLVRDVDVPPFFYVENPVNVVPPRQKESAPRVGVTFSGTRRDVLIQDVVQVLGRRNPEATQSPKLLHQAFIFITTGRRTADARDVAKVDVFRQAWERFFLQATDGRMRSDTHLRIPS